MCASGDFSLDFAHKTGWVDTAGSAAGIVKSFRGKDKRNYIVVVFCNLGTDYVDHNRPARPVCSPCCTPRSTRSSARPSTTS